MKSDELSFLKLLQLGDSALPIGGMAHSFGLEMLVAEELLNVASLEEFLRTYLEEAGVLEGAFCRAGFGAVVGGGRELRVDHWLEVNARLGALKAARESRGASASLGQRFMQLALALESSAVFQIAVSETRSAGVAIHHSPAVGLAACVFGLDADSAVPGYLHQSMAALISACQRLLPLGQTAAAQLLWDLKPHILVAAQRSAEASWQEACCFLPVLDWGAMEHAALHTRLFIS